MTLAVRCVVQGEATPRAASAWPCRPGEPGVIGAWWTDVDQAEFDVLVYALVRGVFRHRERCAACAQSGSAVCCRSVDRAVEEMLDWLQLRSLLSRAEYLAGEKDGHQAGQAG